MENDKLDGFSMDLESDNKQKLQAVFPECFAEGKLDIDKLLSLCGEYIDEDFEKYKFEWKGKANCLKVAQQRSRGTLRPKQAESVNFDTTENLYIEGDNLEVLKLLQTAYYRKVKMIYIDPPYNTGHDFVYEDDFAEPLANYKEVTSQATKSNPETMGRFHTNWLNMMYPRLRLAANLLADDGVIFISIDDHEVHNLRKICDETFGEENFVGELIWNKRIPKNDNKGIGNIHEHLLCYGKNQSFRRQFIMAKEGLDDIFSLLADLKKKNVSIKNAEEELKKLYNKKGYDRGITLYNNLNENYEPWGKINMSWPNADTFGPRFDVLHPRTNQPTKVPDRGWRWNQETFNQNLDYDNVIARHDGSYMCGSIWFAKDENTQPSSIKYLRDVATMLLRSIISLKSDGGVEVEKIFDGKSFFSYPKPVSLLSTIIQSIDEKDGLYLDFFSGSATTAHAVMQLNAEDGGNRKFICVQLPERTDEKSEAHKNGYHNICEIGKERIRRAGKKILEETPKATLEEREEPLDVGFKVLSLDTSNLYEWDGTAIENRDPALLRERLSSMIDGVKDDRSDMDVVYEVMIKMGVTLDVPVTHMEINGKLVYVVGDLWLMICLAENLTLEDVQEMIEYPMGKFVVAEACFGNDDSLMSNLYYIFKNKGVQYQLI
ncbi:MAG: site-specific DNA-methyltransferase [Bacillota bacterium]